MKYLRNQDGIALLTAMMFTLLSLAMISVLLYYVLLGTKMSSAQKVYRNSLEASYGGTDFVTKIVVPRLFDNYSTGKTSLLADFGTSVSLQIGGTNMSTDAILKTKLSAATSDWGTGIARRSTDPKINPDFIFTLKGVTTANDFKVYSKIVDTVPTVGLLDTSGIDYIDAGLGVAGNAANNQTPRTPSVYTIEVQGEASVNPKEKASLTVLYSY